MFFLRQLKKKLHDNSGQSAVEFCMIIACLVIFVATIFHGLLPNLATGFMEMAATIGGPTP